jgi:hypothetical protein
MASFFIGAKKLLHIVFLLGIAGVGSVLVLSVAYRLYKGKPILRPNFEQVRFLETWRSGWSDRDALTRLGGARSCLWIAVIQDELRISPHFPFNLLFIPEVFHWDFRIPGKAIVEMTHRSLEDKSRVIIRFRHATGEEDSFEFTIKDFKEFRNAFNAIRQDEGKEE